MIENEQLNAAYYRNRVFMFESRRKIKHCLIFITFVVPMVNLVLNLLFVWPSSEWNDIYSNSIPIQLYWCLVVPSAVFLLIFVEAYGETIKNYKYYYCVTLFTYEFIGCLSIVTYLYSLINTWSTEELFNMPFETRGVVNLIYFILIGSSYCSQWIKNTFDHISFYRYKIFGINDRQLKTEMDAQRETDPFWARIWRNSPLFFALFFGSLSSILSPFDCSHLPYIQLLLFTPLIYGFLPFVSYMCLCKCGKEIWAWPIFWMWCSIVTGLILIHLLCIRDVELNYPTCILFWISCLLIGRQWFLHISEFEDMCARCGINKIKDL